MFITRTALAGVIALAMTGGVHAQEKHLTLDDIDSLARQKIIDGMKKTLEGAAQNNGSALNAPLPAVAPPGAAVAETPKPVIRKPVAPVSHSTPVSFVGAFSDMSGSYVLYDFNGAIYPARQGTKLLNGWTVTHIDGYQITVAEGKRTWTQVIVAQAVLVPESSSSSLQAVNDLGGPLPIAPGGNSVFIPAGK